MIATGRSRPDAVTPLGLERVLVATSVREDPLVTDGELGPIRTLADTSGRGL
jgi:hypothetical protein